MPPCNFEPIYFILLISATGTQSTHHLPQLNRTASHSCMAWCLRIHPGHPACLFGCKVTCNASSDFFTFDSAFIGVPYVNGACYQDGEASIDLTISFIIISERELLIA